MVPYEDKEAHGNEVGLDGDRGHDDPLDPRLDGQFRPLEISGLCKRNGNKI